METVADLLRAKKAEIELQLKGIATPAEEQGSISFGKRVGEGTSMAVDRLSQVAVHDKLQVTLADIDRALAKVDEGSYGLCDVCRARSNALGHRSREDRVSRPRTPRASSR